MAEELHRLFNSCDIRRWRATLDSYNNVLSAKANRGKKGKAEELLNLDKWYQEELPTIIKERKEAFITQTELTKLMQWKLSRGKFRPQLSQLVQTNGDDTVTQTSKKAFKCLPDVSAAIKVLSKLKAVGPATASAVLCAGNFQVPFMADEAIMGIPDLGKVDYNLKFYLKYLEKIQQCVVRLNKKDPNEDWNEHKVEMVLWTHVTATKIDPDLVQIASKRKIKEENEDSDSDSMHEIDRSKKIKRQK